MFHLLLATALGAAQSGTDVVVAAEDPAVVRSAAFAMADSPFASGGHYLMATAGKPAGPASVRVPAPAGEYYVYVSWLRHPHGAKEVAVHCGGSTFKVDESRFANGLMPEDYPRDDLSEFQGLCSSGLYRLTDRPVRFGLGDVVEVVRSDVADTVTTLEAVVFSPYLYLDDLGNDARWFGKPVIKARAGRMRSREIGIDCAVLMPKQPDAAIQWTLPAAGPCLVSVAVNESRSRAATFPLEIESPKGDLKTVSLACNVTNSGRGPWLDIGVLRSPQGTKLRLKAVAEASTCVDLVRLTPLRESDLVGPGEKGWDTFTLQWETPSVGRPWLESVRVVSSSEEAIGSSPIQPGGDLPQGLRVRVARKSIPVLDAKDGSSFPSAAGMGFRVELAHDYGVTLSSDLLSRERLVWLKSLGVFASKEGDFASARAEIDALDAEVQAARSKPFRSTAEQYHAWTGYDEARFQPRQDDRAFEFAYMLGRPPSPRVSESIAAIPEVDYAYFLSRIDEPKHRRMFLGWPNVCQEFYVLSNGAIGVSSNSGAGTGHPPAEHFTVEFGAGDTPQFNEHGDPSVRQQLEDGYHIIVHTRWNTGGVEHRTTALAYPLAGEDVRTGNEPLAAHVRLSRDAKSRLPLWLKIRPEQWRGPRKPLPDLGKAKIDGSCLVAGPRVVLGFAAARANIAAASDEEVLVKLEPEGENVDLVIPYIAVDEALISRALAMGFPEAMLRTKKYWDDRLSAGTKIDTPDPVVNQLYKTLLMRTLVCGDLDVYGDYALKTSPIHYDAVWLHATAYGIEGLARRGHFREARQYLEAAFRWQGSQESDAAGKVYTTWKGFFNAPPRYTARLWINFHGWMQWAAARYFLFSGDEAWLQEKLPALIESLEWTTSQCRLTMHDNPDGTRPDNYGWLPPGRVTDGSFGTSAFTDCIQWKGVHELTRLLERIGHPRAAEFRAIADDYRACILRGLRRAASRREPVRINDGTYVPYVPAYLESTGHEETMWYAAVVDAGLEGILDSGILSPDDPMEDWVLANLEDNLFVLAPNLADEAYFLGQGVSYLRHDQPQRAIYTFYSVMASHMARQTLTTFEHRSWGSTRIYDLAPWPFGFYTRMLAGMLAWDDGDELIYCQAMPRSWLDSGKQVRVERLQTRFGPTSLVLKSQPDRIQGVLDLPTRQPPKTVQLRLRVSGRVTSVRINGQPAAYDAASGRIAIPVSTTPVHVDASVDRRE